MLKWLGSLTDSNEKQIQRLRPVVDEINDYEAEISKLTDDELKAKTQEFKEYVAEATASVVRGTASKHGRNSTGSGRG